MGVLDGQPVNQSITNSAFINKNQDDSMPNKLSLQKGASGTWVDSAQGAINKIYAATGASETASGTVYGAPANTIVDGDSHQTALTELANKFHLSSGHTHDGSAGSGGPISSSSLSGTSLLQFIQAGAVFSASGSSTDVTSLMSGKTPSSGSTSAGVVVTSPYNRVLLQYADSSVFTDALVDGSGNLVYGRLTYSTGTWTITYYRLVSGVETPASLSAANVRWFYRELFNPITSSSPVYNPIFEFWSRNLNTLNSLFGNILLAATNGTTLNISGQTLTLDSPALSSTSPNSVGSNNTTGSGATSARADHAHQGVHSIAVSGNSSLFGDVVLQEAGNITLTQVGQTINIAATTAVTTVGTLDSQTKSLNGAVVIGNTMYFQTADMNFPGLVSTMNQTFAGVKTFISAISSPQFKLTGLMSGALTLQAAVTTTDYTVFWPAAQGTGVLTNDGAGNLSWSTSVGGGSGGALQWVEGANAPVASTDQGSEVYRYDSTLNQSLTTSIKLPSTYVPGSPVTLRSLAYSPDNSGNLLFQTVATLIRTGIDAITSTTNQRTSMNSALSLGAGTVNVPQSITFDLTDTTGHINGVAVSPGDLIQIQLMRGTDTSTQSAYLMVYASEARSS